MLNQHLLSFWNVKGSNNSNSYKHKCFSVQAIKLPVFITEMKKDISHWNVKKTIEVSINELYRAMDKNQGQVLMALPEPLFLTILLPTATSK
jgi:hypothetical protein